MNDKIKNKKIPNVPHLRFNEFCEQWKKFKLNNITKKVERKNSDNKSNIPLTISAQYGLIDQRHFFNKQVASKDMSNYYLLLNGEFAYNKSYSNGYPVGAIKRLNNYKYGAVSTLYICFSVVDKNTNSDYLSQYFETNKWYSQILEIANEGARNHGLLNVPTNDFFNIKFYKPNLKEQQKIAYFLELIDKRIETQMKIIEEIKSLKNSIVIKVFGDKSKFVKKWVKTKLSDILKERKEYAQKSSKYTHVTLSKEGVVDKTDRYNRDFLVKDEEKEYKVTKLNDICYNPANLKFGVICLNKYGDAIFSPIYVTYEINKNYNPLFIEIALTNSTFIGHVRKYEQGTVYERMAVSSEDFLKGTIIVPSLEEQNNIVKTFNKIDNKLEIEKNILDKLKLQKNYLLNNMFV